MSKISYIVTSVLIVLGGIFAILNQYVWSGFSYFMLATLAILSLFWAIWLIVQFFTTYKKEVDERFEIYRAETINKSGISSEQFDQNREAHKAEFLKHLRRERISKWLYIFFAFILAIMFIISAIFI